MHGIGEYNDVVDTRLLFEYWFVLVFKLRQVNNYHMKSMFTVNSAGWSLHMTNCLQEQRGIKKDNYTIFANRMEKNPFGLNHVRKNNKWFGGSQAYTALRANLTLILFYGVDITKHKLTTDANRKETNIECANWAWKVQVFIKSKVPITFIVNHKLMLLRRSFVFIN